MGSAPPGKRAASEGLRSRRPAWVRSGSAGVGRREREGASFNALCGPRGPEMNTRRGPEMNTRRGPGGVDGRGGKCGGGALQQGGRGEGQPSPRDPFIV